MRWWTLAAGALVAVAVPALAVTYTNAAFGVTITRPDNWQTIEIADAIDNAASALPDSEEKEAALAQYQRSALFVFMKYPISYDGINPTLKLSAHPLPQGFRGTGADIQRAMVRDVSTLLTDVELLEQPVATRIGNADATRMVLRFTMSSEGTDYVITSRVWVILRGRHWLNLATSFVEPAEGEELQKIANTLTLKK